MSINPPARRRPPVNPPPRRRVPPPETPEVDWSVPKGVQPPAFGQKTHNGVTDIAGCVPDERFRPLLICLDPYYRKVPSPRMNWLIEQLRDLTVEQVDKLEGYMAASRYISEFILREHMGYKLMKDDVYDALREYLVKEQHDTTSKTRSNAPQRCIMEFTDDGDVLCDFKAASGPFYCGSLLEIEYHKRDILQRVAS